MQQSELRLIRSKVEFLTRDDVDVLPKGRRGIYVLYREESRRGKKYDVLYLGMARAGKGRGLKRRLLSHARKKRNWTHFSVFEVWDNVRDEEVVELEGLFRHIYRYDTRANSLNVMRSFKKLARVPKLDLVTRSKRTLGSTRHP